LGREGKGLRGKARLKVKSCKTKKTKEKREAENPA